MSTILEPLPVQERILTLDIVRGIALLGLDAVNEHIALVVAEHSTGMTMQ